MQVIISLMNLQAEKIDDQELKTAFQESQNRIHAMSLVHESLHQAESLAEVDLAQYLKRLSETTFQTYRTDAGTIRFISELQSIPVELENSYPIGLVVNELLSNSLKYAFPENQAGEIKMIGQARGKNINLVLSDNGVGFPPGFDWRSSTTLGLHIVRTLVENQLEGEIELDSSRGVKWTISFPV